MLLRRIKLLIYSAVLVSLYMEMHDVNAESQRPLTKIIEREIVEWITVSRTTPSCDMIGCCALHPTTLNQRGTKYLVKFAQIKWKGKIKEIELERSKIETDKILERTVSENPSLSFQYLYQ